MLRRRSRLRSPMSGLKGVSPLCIGILVRIDFDRRAEFSFPPLPLYSGGEGRKSARPLLVHGQSSTSRLRVSARNVARKALRARVSCDSTAFSETLQDAARSRTLRPLTYLASSASR